MAHIDSFVLQWCQSNSEKILNYYLPNVAINNVFSQSNLLEKGDYVIEPERHGDGSPQAFIDICFGDNYAKTMDEIHSNYASYVRYAEKISDGTVLLDIQVLSDNATKTIMFLFTDFVENRKNKENKEKGHKHIDDDDNNDDIDVNNACVESIVDLINTYKEVNDWFIVNKEDIVIDFKDVLKTQDLPEINQILNDFPICHDVIVPEITLNYGNIYKTIKLKLKTNNVSVNLFNNGGGIKDKTDNVGNVIGFEFYHKDLPNKMNWDDAMKACADLGEGWRLPTKEELNLIYKNKDEIGGFANNYYWSSTEYGNNGAWVQYFSNGLQANHGYDSKNYKCSVRAVRDVRKKVKLVDGGGIKNEISDERKAHYLKDGQKILVDTNFVQQSQGKFPNSELKHYGYGDFFLQTENGNISFFRTGNEIDGFSGRSHKLEGDIDLVNKLLDNMSLAGILQEVKIKDL